jgi:hypothetical protein
MELPAEVKLYPCDSRTPLENSNGRGDLMWNGFYFTSDNTKQIQQAIRMTGKPQFYELIMPYINARWGDYTDNTGEVILSDGDLFLLRLQWRWSFSTVIGARSGDTIRDYLRDPGTRYAINL